MSLPEPSSSTPATPASSNNAGGFSPATEARYLSVAEMEAMAKKLRRHIISMIGKASSGHPGGSLSAVEIVTTLYFHLLRHKPAAVS